MPTITFTQETIGCINLFEAITKTRVRDLITNNGQLIFLVQPGQRRLAVANLRKLKEKFKREVVIKEFDTDIRRFIANLIYPIKPKSIIKEGDAIKIIANNSIEKGKLYGRERHNLKNLKDIVKKYFNCDISIE